MLGIRINDMAISNAVDAAGLRMRTDRKFGTLGSGWPTAERLPMLTAFDNLGEKSCCRLAAGAAHAVILFNH